MGNKNIRNELGNNRSDKKGSRSSTPHERSTPTTGRNAPNPAAIQQLQFQQQQLISQLQLVQQKILMVSSLKNGHNLINTIKFNSYFLEQ